MAKGKRRSAIEMVAFHEAEAARYKAMASLNASAPAIEKLIAQVVKVAEDHAVDTKTILKLVTGKLFPKAPKEPVEPPETAAKKPRAKKAAE